MKSAKVRRWLVVLGRGTVWLALLVSMVGLWLHWAGLPATARKWVARRLDRRASISVGALRLRGWSTVEAEQVTWAPRAADALGPTVAAERVYVALHWPALWRGEFPVRGVRIEHGTAAWQPPGEWNLAPVVWSNVAIEAALVTTGVWHVAARGKLDQLEFRLDLRVPEPVTRSTAFHPPSARINVPRLRPTLPDWVRSLCPGFLGPGTLRVQADWTAEEAPRWEITGQGSRLQLGQLQWDRWEVAATAERGVWDLEHVRLELDGQYLRVSGTIPPDMRQAELSISMRLRSDLIAALPLPPPWHRWRASAAWRLDGDLEGDVRVGPTPSNLEPMPVQARLGLTQCEVAGVWIESLHARFTLDAQRLQVHELTAELGRGPGAGPCRLSGEWERTTNEIRLSGETAFDPSWVVPWLGDLAAVQVTQFRFVGPPPRVRAKVRAIPGDADSIELDGHFDMAGVVWNGAWMSQASADVSLRARQWKFEHVQIERPDGAFRGRVEHDEAQRLVRVEGESSIPLPALARWAGPGAHAWLSRIRWDGPTHLRVSAQVDYGRNEQHKGTAELEAERVGYGWLVFDRLRANIAVSSRTVRVTDASGSAFDGTFGGTAEVELSVSNRPPLYQVRAAVTNADFTRLLAALLDRSDPPQGGRLSGHFELSGHMGSGQGPTARGTGYIRIRNGRLTEIPLFGDLSKFLSVLVPGLGFVSQGDFRSAFLVRDGYVETEDAELRGDVLSLRGRGRYYFDGRLKFVVEAQLLRHGWVADVFRLLTSPVTRLMEFDLTGTVRQPVWTPRNFPEQLWPKDSKPSSPAPGM